MNADHWFLWSVALALLGFLSLGKAIWWDTNARDRRKRRRNYGKVIPRVRRPVVQLSVSTARR